MAELELLTIEEAAKILRLSHKTVRRMIDGGLLHGAFKAGAKRGDWRIPQSGLNAYIAKSAKEATKTMRGRV